MKVIMEMIKSAMAEMTTESENAIEVSFKKEAGAEKVEVRIHATLAGTFLALCELTMAWARAHPEEMQGSCIELLRDSCLGELREGRMQAL